MSKPLSLDQAKSLVDEYNKSTLATQKEITQHYRLAREYYAKSLGEVMTMVAPEDQTKLKHYIEFRLLSWPVAGE